MVDMKSIKTGVIGIGSMGRNHARVFSEISDLVAVSDLNEKEGNKIATQFGSKYYKDYTEMLQEVDAVTIAVPTIYHKLVAEEVSSHGVHMLIEKPLASTPKDAEAIISFAKDNDVILGVGHIERHNPVVTYSKEAIDNDEWGDIIAMSSKRVSNYPNRISDVGVIFDLGVHDLDILCYLSSSQVSSVFAVGGKYRNEKDEDHANIMLEFNNGIKTMSEISWLSPMKVRELTLTCSKAYVVINYATQEIEVLKSKFTNLDEGNLFNINQEIESQKIEIAKKEPLKIELENFLFSIETKSSPLVSGEDGLRAVKLAEEATNLLKI